jgi:hypothetical protein
VGAVTKDSPARSAAIPWRRLLAEFAVIVTGVLVALGVEAARETRVERNREAAYLQQLRADLTATSDSLTKAIAVEERARASADRAIEALNSARLPPDDSLVTWTAAATNSAASFYPTMGTVTALVESGELRLIRDGDLRQGILEYHSRVQGTLRIIDAVDPHMWRTMERLGEVLSWASLLHPSETQRFPIDWEGLAEDRTVHAALFDLRLAAHNRLFALGSLLEGLEALRAELDDSSR